MRTNRPPVHQRSGGLLAAGEAAGHLVEHAAVWAGNLPKGGHTDSAWVESTPADKRPHLVGSVVARNGVFLVLASTDLDSCIAPPKGAGREPQAVADRRAAPLMRGSVSHLPGMRFSG